MQKPSQVKLEDFFSSKKKGTERIELESDDEDSDYDEKTAKKGKRAQTINRVSISMSQGEAINVNRKVLSKSTKRQKSKRRRPFSMTKKKDVLKITSQLTDDETKEIHNSFAWAFFTKKLTYTNKLVYDSPQCPSSMNDPPNLEPKLQKLDEQNKRVLMAFRERESQGLLPPVVLKADSR